MEWAKKTSHATVPLKGSILATLRQLMNVGGGGGGDVM
jgi:hypothetical protein